ncbi:Glycine betaine transporter OpuD [Marinomonas aquimarina]|uniref:Glycine betaine transporter OpuD n=1 Tax=Marinomonas aquimarina TaxID=295068 RepID=A0A1A8TFN1_9GAMM|nr:BCCT family transporter [Marinomonas aquimarina]SBS32179.1 Glycine betaine transporter OpuD [Marinomonas aquimarina]
MSSNTKPQQSEYVTDYLAGQDNTQFKIGPFHIDIHLSVFSFTAFLVVFLVSFCLIFQETASSLFGTLRPWLTTQFDWVFAISMNIFVVFCLFLIVSPYGKIKLGGPDATPTYSRVSWIAMLFAAGMGIGLVFYGVLEPMQHTLFPPLGDSATVNSDGSLVAGFDRDSAIQTGMAATLFHWGIHPWAAYAVVSLGLGIFCYNKGMPMTIRSAFYPILGERVWGFPGHCIDTFAALATLAGLATSLGYGATQAAAGLNYIFGLEADNTLMVIIILVVTGIAMFSVYRGLDGGVKRLSEINMLLALALFLFIVFVGATTDILSTFLFGLKGYVTDLPVLSNWVGRDDTDYFHGWTTLYWAWWIAWSPFVGMFIARVSVGRSIREFVLCMLLIPTLVSTAWMAAFGGNALSQMIGGYMDVQQTLLNWTPELSLFVMLKELPFATLSSAMGIILVLVFFITSSDSGSLVVDTICSGGIQETPTMQRLFWCMFEGLIAIALLLGGGLGSLQALAIATGFPFAILCVLMCYSILRGLQDEKRLLS